MYNPAILFMGLWKTKIFSEDSQSPDRYFNTEPPKYEHTIVMFDVSTRRNDIDSRLDHQSPAVNSLTTKCT